jgi:NodT family efflux transporter outer membrane factor (OMF) lipoprotein
MNKIRLNPMQPNSRRMGLLCLAASLLIGACSVGPNYHAPQPKLPGRWAGNANASRKTADSPDPARLARWWQEFHDPQLTALVQEAFRSGLDVGAAKTALRQARASRGIIAGGLWPGLTAGAGYTTSGTGSLSSNSLQSGLASALALDVAGGTRRSLEAAGATIQAAQENIRFVQVTLASEVALDYIQLRSDQEQIAIAQENLQAQQHTAALTRQRLTAGFASGLDTANAEAQVATTASAIPPLNTSLRQNIYAISVLLGGSPDDLVQELSKPGAVPPSPPRIPAGLPSDLLRRRPDIRAAEGQLHAATAQIGVAVSAFFPSFSLTGTVNNQSDLLRTLFNTGARTWSTGPQLNWPILQGGSIASNVRLQKALKDQAYINYQKTVLAALQDVENALVAFTNEQTHYKTLGNAWDQNRRAVELSMRLYTQGASDFLSVLDAERSLYSSQSALAQSKAAISMDLVRLYKALGGGWSETDKVE